MLFVIASAQKLPCEFEGLFSQVTNNFPWGSLLDGLLACVPDLMHGLAAISRSNGQIEIHVNSGGLMEAGTSLEAGAGIICENLYRYGWEVTGPRSEDRSDLSKICTTWARRLAHGRDPRAMVLSAGRFKLTHLPQNSLNKTENRGAGAYIQ